MHLHPIARLALALLFIVLSATMVFSPSHDPGGGSTSAAMTAGTHAGPSATHSDDRAEAIRFFHGK